MVQDGAGLQDVAADACDLTTCFGTPCCGTLCTVPHSDGEGQTYTDCADATGTPGTASTYNANMATLAAEAYPYTNPVICTVTCGTETAIDICSTSTCATCYASWCYAGACAGYVLLEAAGHATYCADPSTGQTWN